MKIKFKTIVCHFYCTINSEKMLKSPVCNTSKVSKSLLPKKEGGTGRPFSLPFVAPSSTTTMAMTGEYPRRTDTTNTLTFSTMDDIHPTPGVVDDNDARCPMHDHHPQRRRQHHPLASQICHQYHAPTDKVSTILECANYY